MGERDVGGGVDAVREPSPWVFRLAELMDSEFRLPGTGIRFGIDPIIGLIPVIGDGATSVMGLAIVWEAYRLELGWGVVARMVWNLLVDFFVGLVPGLDLVLDVAWKANRRNARLLREALAERGVDERRSVEGVRAVGGVA